MARLGIYRGIVPPSPGSTQKVAPMTSHEHGSFPPLTEAFKTQPLATQGEILHTAALVGYEYLHPLHCRMLKNILQLA